MKRQNSTVSSSSRRENAPEMIQSKAIGCMSGIIHLVCKPHSSRRFLTFGKKQIKNESSFPAKAELPKQALVEEGENFNEVKPNACLNPMLSREAPRSPTLPADIRRSNPAKTPENLRTPPALVARLMGLDEGPAATKPESVADKRERLLNALQKCDEDLKALKKIIEAVRSADQQRTPSLEVVSKNGSCFEDKIRTVTEVNCSEFKGEQQPSPVSVLDEVTRSPVSFRNYSQQHSNQIGRVQQQKIQLQKKPGEENTCFYEKIMTSELVHKKVKDEEEESVMWSKRAMIESVEEVCRDIVWGEKREIGRIGLALHDHICRDLIDEIVRDLGCCCFNDLPFEACKRRLSF
ncbi:uncharacterized protein LOC129295643 [Prosopis cineraria]|uniref:uncharacterized protein LOC129295643 n=1 Tax=Prosopis cineraria TaxID=364024 RepID=UPI0024103F67|nr:uncharacterized protein LOC129295643 [Prosopis cineraria]